MSLIWGFALHDRAISTCFVAVRVAPGLYTNLRHAKSLATSGVCPIHLSDRVPILALGHQGRNPASVFQLISD